MNDYRLYLLWFYTYPQNTAAGSPHYLEEVIISGDTPQSDCGVFSYTSINGARFYLDNPTLVSGHSSAYTSENSCEWDFKWELEGDVSVVSIHAQEMFGPYVDYDETYTLTNGSCNHLFVRYQSGISSRTMSFTAEESHKIGELHFKSNRLGYVHFYFWMNLSNGQSIYFDIFKENL